MKNSFTTFHHRLKILGFSSYSQYLKSTHWQNFRKKYWRQKKRRVCFCCYKTGYLEMHHITYKRLGKEKLSDVVLLCQNCHNRIHKSKSIWAGVKALRDHYKKGKIRRWFGF